MNANLHAAKIMMAIVGSKNTKKAKSKNKNENIN